MIFAYDSSDIDWVIGLGIMFALSFIMTIILKGDLSVFVGFLAITNGIIVYAGLLDTWTLIVTVILAITVIYFNFKRKGGDET